MHCLIAPSVNRAALASILVLLLTVSTQAANTFQHPLVASPQVPSLEIRGPRIGDAPGIAAAILDAFYDTPHVVYMNQYRDEYPDDAFNCFNASIAEQIRIGLGDRGRATLGIVDGEGDDEGQRVITSVAIWQIGKRVRERGGEHHQLDDDVGAQGPLLMSLFGVLNPGHGQDVSLSAYEEPEACINRRDVNKTREAYILEQLRTKEARWLADIPFDRQLYLHTIGTMRRYQGRDIAGELLREGLRFSSKHQVGPERDPSTDRIWVEEARGEEDFWATLIATEAGEPLYFENGYQSRANVTFPTMDGDDEFRFDVMLRHLD